MEEMLNLNLIKTFCDMVGLSVVKKGKNINKSSNDSNMDGNKDDNKEESKENNKVENKDGNKGKLTSVDFSGLANDFSNLCALNNKTKKYIKHLIIKFN